MHIPTVKTKYRYRLLDCARMTKFCVYDLKTAQIVTQKNLSREEAEEKVRELTDLAILEEKNHRRAIRLGYS